MDEAVILKVDIDVYQNTLEKLKNILTELGNKKRQLQAHVDKLGSEVFQGSDVQSTIDLAQKQMLYVQNAINKVTAQREAIMQHLISRETAATTIQSDVTGIDEALPDIFASSN